MRTMGRVKWFDAEQGIGCVVSEGGTQSAVSRAVVARFGLQTLHADAMLTYEMKLEKAGLTVTEIYEIDGRAGPLNVNFDGHLLAKIRKLQAGKLALTPDARSAGAGPWEEGVCKFFSRPKGYGFVETAGGARDVFVHMDVMRRSGVRELQCGQRVLVRVKHGERGAVAVEVMVDALSGRRRA